MDVRQLARREPFGELLRRTLRHLWSWRSGLAVDVASCDGDVGAGTWWGHPLLSVYCVPAAAPPVRRFAADLFRYTNVPWRAAPQWFAGTLFASHVSRLLGWGPGFVVDPPQAGTDQQLVLPGNRRVRLLEFHRGHSVVALKAGFRHDEFDNEIAARRTLPPGAAPELLEVDLPNGIFVERLVAGRSLARCPIWADRSAFQRRALQILRDWQKPTLLRTPIHDYLARLAASIDARAAEYERSFGSATLRKLCPVRERLESIASACPAVVTGRTHGDFQAGNILVSSEGRVILIDFERWGVRAADYDRLVLGLNSRSPPARSLRFQRFLDNGVLRLPEETEYAALPRPTRQAVLARFLLEEIDWYLQDAVGGPFAHEPRELHVLLDDVGSLLGGPPEVWPPTMAPHA